MEKSIDLSDMPVANQKLDALTQEEMELQIWLMLTQQEQDHLFTT